MDELGQNPEGNQPRVSCQCLYIQLDNNSVL